MVLGDTGETCFLISSGANSRIMKLWSQRVNPVITYSILEKPSTFMPDSSPFFPRPRIILFVYAHPGHRFLKRTKITISNTSFHYILFLEAYSSHVINTG